MKARRENRAIVVPAISDVLATATAHEWTRRLAPLGVVVAEVQGLDDALADPATIDRGLVVQLGDGTLPLRAIGNPIRCDGVTTTYGLPPLLGEHNDALLGAARSDPADKTLAWT